MTALSTNRGRRAIRTTVAVGAVSLGLIALTGCEKPTPYAHFTLGSSSSSHETADDCYGHGETLGAERAQTCIEETDEVPVFTVETGDTFRIGVDPEIAETGWLVFYNGQPYDANPNTTTYQTFSVDELYQAVRQQTPGQLPTREPLEVLVAQVSEDYDMEEIWSSSSQEQYQERLFGSFEGVWNVELEPAD